MHFAVAEYQDPFTDVLGTRRGAGRRAPSTLTVTNPLTAYANSERAFTFHAVYPGERYGKGRVLTNTNAEPLVEVFDPAYIGNPEVDEHGQLIRRYCLSELRERDANDDFGLDLTGSRVLARWTVRGEVMPAVMAWLREL